MSGSNLYCIAVMDYVLKCLFTRLCPCQVCHALTHFSQADILSTGCKMALVSGEVLLTVICNTDQLAKHVLNWRVAKEHSMSIQGRIWVTPIGKLNIFNPSDNTPDHFTTTCHETFDTVLHLSTCQSMWPFAKLLFHHKSCQRFAMIPAIADNSNYSPAIREIKQTPNSPPRLASFFPCNCGFAWVKERLNIRE